MRLGFILPSSDYLFDPFRGDPFTQFHLLTILENSLNGSLELDLIDLRGVKKEFAAYRIPECDLYLYSVYTLDYAEQLSLVAELRQHYPRAKHIGGGPHVMAFPKESAEVFDALVFGEGEESILQIVKDWQKLKLQPLYQQDHVIDINDYSYWKRHFLPKSSTARKSMMTLHDKPGYDQLLGTTVLFSRGCPYHCHFCAITRTISCTPPLRHRSPENIEKEIEYLKREYGIQGISLQDEIGIPLNPSRAVEQLEAIGRTNILWRGQCRVDGLTHEIATLAKQSGCLAMGLGVESVHQPSLDIINKQINVEESKKTIAILKECDIEARLYIIIGLPGEPQDIVEKTWSFIEEVQPDLVTLSLFTIRPGTEVYNHPERFGITEINTDWSKTMHTHGRSDERPILTFRYLPQTVWGQSLSPKKIIANYVELRKRLQEKNLSFLTSPPTSLPETSL